MSEIRNKIESVVDKMLEEDWADDAMTDPENLADMAVSIETIVPEAAGRTPTDEEWFKVAAELMNGTVIGNGQVLLLSTSVHKESLAQELELSGYELDTGPYYVQHAGEESKEFTPVENGPIALLNGDSESYSLFGLQDAVAIALS